MKGEKTQQDQAISIERVSTRQFRQAYKSPELFWFGAIADLTTSGSNAVKEENTGNDCDNNATRYGTQPCTKP